MNRLCGRCKRWIPLLALEGEKGGQCILDSHVCGYHDTCDIMERQQEAKAMQKELLKKSLNQELVAFISRLSKLGYSTNIQNTIYKGKKSIQINIIKKEEVKTDGGSKNSN